MQLIQVFVAENVEHNNKMKKRGNTFRKQKKFRVEVALSFFAAPCWELLMSFDS
jgi:hypothetical protein